MGVTPDAATHSDALLARATADFRSRAQAVPVDAWSNDTPCGIPVREVIDHVVAGNLFAVRLLAGATAEEATADLDTPPADPLAAIRTTGAAQLEAFAHADRNRLLHHPSRDIDYTTFVRFRLGELVIHGWDLSSGTDLDPGLAEGLWRMVEPHLDDMRAMGAYGTGATGRPLTSTPARLLDAFGRS